MSSNFHELSEARMSRIGPNVHELMGNEFSGIEKGVKAKNYMNIVNSDKYIFSVELNW